MPAADLRHGGDDQSGDDGFGDERSHAAIIALRPLPRLKGQSADWQSLRSVGDRLVWAVFGPNCPTSLPASNVHAGRQSEPSGAARTDSRLFFCGG